LGDILYDFSQAFLFGRKLLGYDIMGIFRRVDQQLLRAPASRVHLVLIPSVALTRR
jgi:hypothetical protein